jgi:uncharacterized protein (TIGR03437 family)
MKIDRNLLVFGVFLLAAPFAAYAQTTPVTCSNASLTGTHSLTLTGRNVSSSPSVLSNVYLAVGTATFDGVGSVTFNLTTTTNQSAAPQTQSGIYNLPANCLGTLNITSGDTASYTLIPYASNASFSLTGQDATYSLSGTGGLQPTACNAASLSGAFTFTGNGYGLKSGAVTGVNSIAGALQFDGVSAVTGNWSVITNGASTPVAVTGQYTSSGCSATVTLTDANGLSYTLSLLATGANPTLADGSTWAAILSSQASLFTATLHSAFTNPGLAVGNSAGSGGITPGALFTIYGTGLSTGTTEPSNPPLPKTLDSATIMVNGTEVAPIYYANDKALVTSGIINAQMPWDIQPGLVTIVVKNGTAVSNTVAVPVYAAAPGIYYNPLGTTHALAQNYPSYATNSDSSPAPAGSVVIVYFNGGGLVQGQSSLTTGAVTPDASFPVTSTFSATIASAGVPAPATVTGIALTPTEVGLYQADIVIPIGTPKGDHNLVLTINGKASAPALISTN